MSATAFGLGGKTTRTGGWAGGRIGDDDSARGIPVTGPTSMMAARTLSGTVVLRNGALQSVVRAGTGEPANKTSQMKTY
jgi:hypothetical protein